MCTQIHPNYPPWNILTMTIIMCVIMTMNIYMTTENEELLRRYDGSMSGLVNRLLGDFFKGNPSAATGVRREVDKVDEPDVSEWAEHSKGLNLERACCLSPVPCKHWAFDGDTSLWTNSISGRTKEA